MNILFIADPLESFKIYKDTTFAMMREAQRRGHTVAACEPQDVMWQRGDRVTAHVRDIGLTGDRTAGSRNVDARAVPLKDFDAILMRKDPPFDSEYFYATHLLEQAERDGRAGVQQARRAARPPGKARHHGVSAVHRPHAGDARRGRHQALSCRAPATSSSSRWTAWAAWASSASGPDGLNLGSITETLNRHGAQSLMVQKFLPEIVDGDKRVLVIGGKPVPFCLARIPQGSEVRGNLAAGGKGVARPISARDREIAEALGPVLAARGLLLVGLDVIGDCLTEINVTSPTCFQEIFDQTGCDVAALFIDALEAALRG
jgi:glutathione synthase